MWYRVGELSVVVTAVTCFTTQAFAPEFALRWGLRDIDRFISVLFFLDFFLKWWARRFAFGWLKRWRTVTEIVSSLPGLDIFLTSVDLRVSNLGAVLNTLRLFRMLRFSRVYTDTFSLGFRIFLVFLSVAAVVSNSASMLWLAEHGSNPNMQEPLDAVYLAFSLLTSEGAVCPIETSRGKLVSMATILVGLSLIIPQLADVFIRASGDSRKHRETTAERAFWANSIRRMDELEIKTLLPQDVASRLREFALSRDESFGVLLQAYHDRDEVSLAKKFIAFDAAHSEQLASDSDDDNEAELSSEREQSSELISKEGSIGNNATAQAQNDSNII